MKLFHFDNSYARLPLAFYQAQQPSPVRQPQLIAFNEALAADLHMQRGNEEELAALFSGNVIPEGAEPIAMAYAGHQFGHFVPQLGDGRAVLLGEVVDKYGVRRDIQLKGSGRTPFSRRGDGRAALGPVMREYIVSEAMHALGIKTTRSLAAVTTGEPVMRETMLPGAVLTRVAKSHIRIGTFEYFAAQGEWDAVRTLADYAIERLYPDAREAANPYAMLLEKMIEAQASLIASWMQVGFIHGVMNTDNMALSGETIDYGPCAFIDNYDPLAVFSAIDQHGRYAFGQQPRIAQWNLVRFAETLVPLLADEMAQAVSLAESLLNSFPARFEQHWLSGMRKKLGLFTIEEEDSELAQQFLMLMHKQQADFTISFRALSKGELPFASGAQWMEKWRARLAKQSESFADSATLMRSVNPAYIPRNHRIEQAIVAAVEREDFMPMRTLMEVLAAPYEEREEYADYALPPKPDERVLQTFCGT